MMTMLYMPRPSVGTVGTALREAQWEELSQTLQLRRLKFMAGSTLGYNFPSTALNDT